MKRAMGELERMYFQWARGRAIRIRHLLRAARAEKRLWNSSMVTFLVAQARTALREWRRYRREMADCRERGI